MKPAADSSPRTRLIGLLAGPGSAFLLSVFFDLEPGHPEITHTAGIALWMAVWWITECVPLAVTALLPIVLFPFLGILDGKTVSSAYVNHIIFLFIGGFIVALAMERWNLHKRIALKILIHVGVRPRNILLGFMLATAFLSMWISNTAATMMMVPIVLAVVVKLEDNLDQGRVRKYSIGLFLGVAYGATLGGIATLVGTPPNLAFARIFSISFPNAPEISFANWFLFALPVSFVFLVLTWLLLSFFFLPRGLKGTFDSSMFHGQIKELGPFTFEERVVLINFLALVFLWIFRADIVVGSFTIPGWSRFLAHPEYINDGTVAILVGILLFVVPARNKKGARIMDWKTAKKLPWNIVLLFGGGFALAQALRDTGLSLWLANQLSGLQTLHPLLIVMAVSLLLVFLTELTSNTATAEFFLPILAALSVVVKINPLFLMIPGTLACSLAFMLPVATPPNAIIFGTGRLKISDMARVGLYLNILGVVLIGVAIIFLGNLVLGIDLDQFPAWATQ